MIIYKNFVKKELHIISGTTAVGKTDYALDFAESIDAEIISCDASLVYKGMDIGTAKPSKEDLARVKHHCIDLHPVSKPFDITLYESRARRAVQTILDRGKAIVITGGSGFYLKSFFEPVVDPVLVSSEIRSFVGQLFERSGLEGLLKALESHNPEGFGNLDVLNPRRVQRALERCMASGKSLPELQEAFAKQVKPYADFEKRLIVLERDSEDLKSRIVLRAEAMLKLGLVEEVQRLKKMGIEKNPNASGAIGYRETLAFLEGSIDESQMLSLIIKNTNALVKKQRTWFRTQIQQADTLVKL